MGQYASKFQESETYVADNCHPNDADWITAHATTSGLAIVEVERLWCRFQMLGCDKDGVLSGETLLKLPATKDIFIKNILTTFRSEDGNIAFQSFINAMQWAENATVEEKLRAVFQLLNNGEEVSRDLLARVLRRVYPEDSEERTQEVTDIFFEEMDKDNRGSIDEEEFVKWARKIRTETMETILDFYIIPPDINDEAHRTFTSMTSRSDDEDQGRGIPSSRMLDQIARKIHKKDWHVLANHLGITSQEIRGAQRKHSKDTKAQVLDILTTWKTREGSRAYAETLEDALKESNMNDAALALYP